LAALLWIVETPYLYHLLKRSSTAIAFIPYVTHYLLQCTIKVHAEDVEQV